MKENVSGTRVTLCSLNRERDAALLPSPHAADGFFSAEKKSEEWMARSPV